MAKLDTGDSPRANPRTASKAVDRAMVDTAYKVDAVVGGSAIPANGSAPAVRDLTLDLVKGAPGINFTWAILVSLLHCSDHLHAGVVQAALETTMGV